MAVNLAQLVARESHSKLSRRNTSLVVPACINALAMMVDVCKTELLCSIAVFVFFSINKSVWLFLKRKSKNKLIVVSPERIVRSFSRFATYGSVGLVSVF